MGMSPIPTRQSAASALVSVVLLVLFAIANARGFIRFFQTRMRFPDIALTYDPILSPYPAEDTFVSRWRYIREPMKIFSCIAYNIYIVKHKYLLLAERLYSALTNWSQSLIRQAIFLFMCQKARQIYIAMPSVGITSPTSSRQMTSRHQLNRR